MNQNSFSISVSTPNFTNWADYTNNTTLSITNRGYTTHEHMPQYGLINMNGRLYDPTLARMLNADPFIADATSAQDFNRYSYVRNNPLKYTDPSGYRPSRRYFHDHHVSSSSWNQFLNSKYGRNTIGIDGDPSMLEFYWFANGGNAGGGGSGTYQLIMGISAAGNGFEATVGDVIGGNVYLQSPNGTLISNDQSANMARPVYNIETQKMGYFIDLGWTRAPYEWPKEIGFWLGIKATGHSQYTYEINVKFIERHNSPEYGFQGDFMGIPVISSSLLNSNASFYAPGYGVIFTAKFTDKYPCKYLLAHEYGHSVQESIWGTYTFILRYGIPSLFSYSFNRSNHGNMPWEINANYYGFHFLHNVGPDSLSWWNSTLYPYE